MFEKELRIYLKAAASFLPCPEAKKLFTRYVYSVSQDICSEKNEKDFSAVLSQLGTDPQRAARDFVESQSQETIARWHDAARRHKVRKHLALGLTVGVLMIIIAFFVVTKGVFIVNTDTTIINWGNTDMTQEEILERAMKQPLAKE